MESARTTGGVHQKWSAICRDCTAWRRPTGGGREELESADSCRIHDHGWSSADGSRAGGAKGRGQSYETDAEFYDRSGAVHLQIEAKASSRQTEALAAAIVAHGQLDELPTAAAKEIEYVLDLQPRFLWVVGPEPIQPAKHVFMVSASGNNASFTSVESLPAPPT